MKLTLATALLLALGSSAFADDTCVDVSADGKAWSKTPEMLCVSNVKDADYTLALRTGMPGSQVEVMTLHLNLVSRVRCIDCNKDVFGIANPSNSIANALQVKFDGKRDAKTLAETGIVHIGATKLFYRRAAAPVTTLPATAPIAKPVPPPATPRGQPPSPPKADATMSPPTHAPDPVK
jgi:hypothetical protein